MTPKPVLPDTDFDAHGGPDGRSHVTLDFSVNSNPFGPSERLLEHLKHTPVQTYPDPSYVQEKHLVAHHHYVEASQVSLGHGTVDLIHRLSRCYLDASRRVLIAAPTFGEYARAARLCGAQVHHCFPYEESSPDAGAVLRDVRALRPTLVWLCHPNNPTGHAWVADDLASIAHACAEADALLILDAAYLEFLDTQPEIQEVAQTSTNLLQLHSLTKSFRIPGVRLGYALGPVEVVRVLERSAPPWHLSSHAGRALQWALSEAGQAFLQATLPELHTVRLEFQAELRGLGLEVHDTSTNYFLTEVVHAPTFKRSALQAGFRVRDCASFGLPTKVRLAAQQPHENQVFIDWLRTYKFEEVERG